MWLKHKPGNVSNKTIIKSRAKNIVKLDAFDSSYFHDKINF